MRNVYYCEIEDICNELDMLKSAAKYLGKDTINDFFPISIYCEEHMHLFFELMSCLTVRNKYLELSEIDVYRYGTNAMDKFSKMLLEYGEIMNCPLGENRYYTEFVEVVGSTFGLINDYSFDFWWRFSKKRLHFLFLIYSGFYAFSDCILASVDFLKFFDDRIISMREEISKLKNEEEKAA